MTQFMINVNTALRNVRICLIPKRKVKLAIILLNTYMKAYQVKFLLQNSLSTDREI